jgi:hypothetical protein
MGSKEELEYAISALDGQERTVSIQFKIQHKNNGDT